jgi:hypothetical protein
MKENAAAPASAQRGHPADSSKRNNKKEKMQQQYAVLMSNHNACRNLLVGVEQQLLHQLNRGTL